MRRWIPLPAVCLGALACASGPDAAQPFRGAVWSYVADGFGSAYFVPGSAAPPTPTCAAPARQSGACCYYALAPDAGPSRGATTVPQVSAGTLTLGQGSAVLGVLVFDAGYPILSFAVHPGELLSVSATGDPAGVAAFEGTLVAPGPFTGLAPAEAATPLSVPRSQDFTLAWDPGEAGSTVTLLLADSPARQAGGQSIGEIVCTAEDSAGTLTVPATLLGHFGAGDPGTWAIRRRVTGAWSRPPANAAVTLWAIPSLINQGSTCVYP